VEQIESWEEEPDAQRACYERLRDEGVNLSAYNSAQAATDVADLMRLLRDEFAYQNYVLFGSSYGTRLALTVMRDHPGDIGSVILDSVYPPNIDAYERQPTDNLRAMRLLFAGCAADPACNAAYPDLETVFYSTVTRLNDQPATYDTTDPMTGETYEAMLYGDDLTDLLVNALYDTALIPELPRMIYAASQGDYAPYDSVYYGEAGAGYRRQDADFEEDFTDSEGLFNSVECYEEVPFNSLDEVRAVVAPFPDAVRDKLLWDVESVFDTCAVWQVGAADALENEAVTVSGIPTLILTGEYDPITPPASGRLAGETIAGSYFYEFPGVGHSAIDAGECPLDITLAFLDDPLTQPDGKCIASMQPPAFVTE
jgi:pimeloyl-ACP methyl ester carboxylesterase